jgi:hypothetical protein
MTPFPSRPGHRAEGLFAMVARMNRIENAARLAMADLGSEATVPISHSGLTFNFKLGLLLVSLAMTGLIAISLL